MVNLAAWENGPASIVVISTDELIAAASPSPDVFTLNNAREHDLEYPSKFRPQEVVMVRPLMKKPPHVKRGGIG